MGNSYACCPGATEDNTNDEMKINAPDSTKNKLTRHAQEHILRLRIKHPKEFDGIILCQEDFFDLVYQEPLSGDELEDVNDQDNLQDKLRKQMAKIENLQIVAMKNGSIYKGQWKDKKRNGYGIQYWPVGSSYEGEWINDKLNGYGTFEYSNGDVHKGDWIDDYANGYGILIKSSGFSYEGYWLKNEQNGEGKIIYTDGRMWEGNFKEG